MWNKVKKVYIWDKQVRPVILPYLCFTAEQANSTVKLNKNGSPTSVTLETSTDWSTWNTYIFGNAITLTNVWDRVFFRNTSETTTRFNSTGDNRYQFVMTGSIAWSWDITSLLNKNWTDTLSDYCFINLFEDCKELTTAPELPATTLARSCYYHMFYWCTSLTATPELPATTLAAQCYKYMFEWCTSSTTATSLPATTLVAGCYENMFNWCSNLTTLPKLPATTIIDRWYWAMFYNCSKIKLSTTQTWEYQTPYRIPTAWTWSIWTDSFTFMFSWTWWTFTSNPTVNTTYYTSNTVI